MDTTQEPVKNTSRLDAGRTNKDLQDDRASKKARYTEGDLSEEKVVDKAGQNDGISSAGTVISGEKNTIEVSETDMAGTVAIEASNSEDGKSGKTESNEQEDMGSAEIMEKPVRLRACERKRLKREAKHAEFLEERKRKRKQVKERRKEKYKDMTEEEKAAHRLPKWMKMADGCKQRIAIDMGWDQEMNAKELTNAVTQVNRCYSINRRATPPVQFYVTDSSAQTCAVFDKSAPDYKRWDIHFKTEAYLDLFPKEELVYLTADSPNVIETLDESKVYIIGGIVDHNRLKNACYNRATQQGIQHAQLPIGEHMQMNSRRVLTINHVFEILTRYKQFGDWKQAFVQTIPERKQRAGHTDSKEPSQTPNTETKVKAGESDGKGVLQTTNTEGADKVTTGHTDSEEQSHTPHAEPEVKVGESDGKGALPPTNTEGSDKVTTEPEGGCESSVERC